MKKKTYITPAQQIVRLETAPLLVNSKLDDETTDTQWAPSLILDDEE